MAKLEFALLTCGYVDRSRGRAVITESRDSVCVCKKGRGFTADDVLESTTEDVSVRGTLLQLRSR